MKPYKPLLKKIGNIVFAVVIVLLVIVASIALFSRISVGRVKIGAYTFGVISSGSMEPELHIGTFVLIKETDPAALQVGDVITFYSDDPNVPNGDPVSHKIVQIDTDAQGSRTFTTKGTANPATDQ
ncbi:MAG: signal peptidase I [Clostridia bacterium]|nr:signal peptidase I [Clostridia bacterium]